MLPPLFRKTDLYASVMAYMKFTAPKLGPESINADGSAFFLSLTKQQGEYRPVGSQRIANVYRDVMRWAGVPGEFLELGKGAHAARGSSATTMLACGASWEHTLKRMRMKRRSTAEKYYVRPCKEITDNHRIGRLRFSRGEIDMPVALRIDSEPSRFDGLFRHPVAKTFGSKVHHGRVASWDRLEPDTGSTPDVSLSSNQIPGTSGQKIYRVIYEDGDFEDMDYQELALVLDFSGYSPRVNLPINELSSDWLGLTNHPRESAKRPLTALLAAPSGPSNKRCRTTKP